MIPYAELVPSVEYILVNEGGCPAMRTTVKRVFHHFNNEGYPLFFDNSMGCLVAYKEGWAVVQKENY
jgi:hypothetical protein